MDTLRAELCVSGLTAELEFSLLSVVRAFRTGSGTLVSRVSADTCVIPSSPVLERREIYGNRSIATIER